MAAVIEIEHRPIRKLVILEYVQYPTMKALSEAMASIIKAGVRVILTWAGGVAFFHQPIPWTTERIMKDRLRGEVYWSSILFSLMPDYKPSIRVGKVDVPIMNVSPNLVFSQVADWLKDHTR